MTETQSEPRRRVRLNLTHSIKDGWRPNETTVEVEWTDGGFDHRTEIDRLLREAHHLGTVECRRRNDDQAA